jgi:hypothetical protein
MNRNVYRRIHDGAPVTEDEALDAFGVLKTGYGQWVALPLMMKDAAPGSQSVTLSDSDIAYEQMKIWDANAWRSPGSQTTIQQADSAQPVRLGDAATEYQRMIEHDQNAWRNPAPHTTTRHADSGDPAGLGDCDTEWRKMNERNANAWKTGV